MCACADTITDGNSWLKLIANEYEEYFVVSVVNLSDTPLCVELPRYGTNVWYEIREQSGEYVEDPNPPPSYSSVVSTVELRRSGSVGIVVWKKLFLPKGIRKGANVRFRYVPAMGMSELSATGCTVRSDIDIVSGRK